MQSAIGVRACFMFTVVLLASLISACQEKIPEGPQKEEILEVKLTTLEGRTTFAPQNQYDLMYKLPPTGMSATEWEQSSACSVGFVIKVYNHFDEAVEGARWLDLKIHVWPTDPKKNWRRTLRSADTTSQRDWSFPPGDSLRFYDRSLIWWQCDDAGRLIHATEEYVPVVVTPRLGWKFVTLEGRKSLIRWIYCDTTYLAPVDTVVAFDGPVHAKAQAEVKLFREYHTLTSNEVDIYIVYNRPEGLKKKYRCSEHPLLQYVPGRAN
jgi:hypothetical protein